MADLGAEPSACVVVGCSFQAPIFACFEGRLFVESPPFWGSPHFETDPRHEMGTCQTLKVD